jgi:hypothetical protein
MTQEIHLIVFHAEIDMKPVLFRVVQRKRLYGEYYILIN